MSRTVSFVVLVAILLVIGGLFVRVMANFLLPMFMAVLLAVMAGPLHRWFLAKCRDHDRLAALLTTASILLIFLVPLLLIILQAVSEGVAIYHRVNDQPAATAQAKQALPDKTLPPPDAEPDRDREVTEPERDRDLTEPAEPTSLQLQVADSLSDLGRRVGLHLTRDDIDSAISSKIQQWVAPVVLSTGQFMLSLALGLFVMVISLYYFLVDGPGMIRAIMRLSPLDDRYEEQLIDEFENISRAVVLATVASALAQGLLAGIGYYLVGMNAVFLLIVLTMLLAMVPFVGAAAVWVPVCLYLFFFTERTGAAIGLAIYGGAVVSLVDNIIKPIILHGRSNMHPLLALLSVLGGVQALGPIGIFVGPMVVSFLHALLEMLHTELTQIEPKIVPAMAGALSPGSAPPPESDSPKDSRTSSPPDPAPAAKPPAKHRKKRKRHR